MQIVNKNINELKAYENNPRNNREAIQYVIKSIKEFGFKVPIVIDTNNVIVSGHTRYEASKQLGLEEVPCVVIDDLNEQQVNAFRIADNKVAERAEWDWDKLADELGTITDIDMEEFGFEDIIKGQDLTDFDLSYIADYKIYVKSEDPEEIELAKKIVGEYDGNN